MEIGMKHSIADLSQSTAFMRGSITSVFGWGYNVGQDCNPRSIRNWPLQANAAEMMRLATIRAVRDGIRVCAIVHDAFLIEAPKSEIDDAVYHMREIMAEASRLVLRVLSLRTSCKITRFPDRYEDPRGKRMWSIFANCMSVSNPDGSRHDLASR